MIGIIDYGMGNLRSVFNAFEYLGVSVKVCNTPKEIEEVDRIVIPGVGAIAQCIQRLTENGFVDELNEQVLIKCKPTLGICLGMQVMSNRSYEGGEYNCLGWFDAEVVKICQTNSNIKVPNIGWNSIDFDLNIKLFNGIPQGSDFYFVHSYYVNLANIFEKVADYEYGG